MTRYNYEWGMVRTFGEPDTAEVVADGGQTISVGSVYETAENGRWKVVDERSAEEGEVPEPTFLVRAINAPNADTGHEEWLTVSRVVESARTVETPADHSADEETEDPDK